MKKGSDPAMSAEGVRISGFGVDSARKDGVLSPPSSVVSLTLLYNG